MGCSTKTAPLEVCKSAKLSYCCVMLLSLSLL